MKKRCLLFSLISGFFMFESFSAPLSPPVSSLKPSVVNIQNIKTNLGLTSWLVENSQSPVVSLFLAFRDAGSKMDPEGKAGLCSYLTKLLQEGAGEFDARAFKEYLLEKNIQLSVYSTMDCLYINIRTIKENIDDALKMVHLMLTQPRFDKRDCDRVQQQMLTFYSQMLVNEGGRLKDKFNETIYGQHPYGQTYGERFKNLSSLTPEILKQYMKDRLCRDCLVVSAAGHITAQHLSELLDKTVGKLPEKAIPCTLGQAPFLNKGTLTVDHFDIPQSLLVFVHPGIKRNDPSFFAALIVSKILGDGGFESRLWNEIREKRGLTYGIGCQLNWSDQDALLMGQTSTKNESVGEMVNLIKQEWQKMANHGVTSEEVNFVKDRLIGSFALGFSSTHQIAAALTSYQLDHLPIDYINTRNSLIRDVTLEQIQAAIKTFIFPKDLTFIIVGKPVFKDGSKGLEPTPSAVGG